MHEYGHFVYAAIGVHYEVKHREDTFQKFDYIFLIKTDFFFKLPVFWSFAHLQVKISLFNG